MIKPRIHRLRIATLVALLLLAYAVSAAATQATVLTNLGGLAEGSLTGLDAVLQLRAPDEVRIIGPMQQYDIPLSSIRQISIDFPRLVIETETGVVIGPYSAFLGIADVLSLTTDTGTIQIPVTSLRALALNGRALKAVPREWMGNRFLSEPEIVAAAPLQVETCVDCVVKTTSTTATTASTTSDSTVVWNSITPETTVEESSEFPWWLGIVAVAALVILLYSLGSSGSSS